MAVPVKKDVDPAGMRKNIRVGPGPAVLLEAAMAQHKDEIRSFGPGIIHGALYGGVQALAGLIAQEVIDILPRLVLKMAG